MVVPSTSHDLKAAKACGLRTGLCHVLWSMGRRNRRLRRQVRPMSLYAIFGVGGKVSVAPDSQLACSSVPMKCRET